MIAKCEQNSLKEFPKKTFQNNSWLVGGHEL